VFHCLYSSVVIYTASASNMISFMTVTRYIGIKKTEKLEKWKCLKQGLPHAGNDV